MKFLQHCVVINLDRREDKLLHVTKELQRVGLSWQRFSGVDGQCLSDALAERVCVDGEEHIYPLLAQRKGVAGCSLSHHYVILEAKRSAWPQVLVVEDDAVFHPRFREFWELAVLYLPLDWQLLRLCVWQTAREQERVLGPWYCTARGQAYGTVAYVARESVYDELLSRFNGRLQVDWAWGRHKRSWSIPWRDEIRGAYHHPVPLLVSTMYGFSDIMQASTRYGLIQQMKRW